MLKRNRWTAISLLCVTILAGCSGGTSVVPSGARRPGSSDSFALDPAANGPQLSVPQRTGAADASADAGVAPTFQVVQTTSTASGAQAFTSPTVSEDQFDQNPNAVARLDQTLVMTLENPSQAIAGLRTMADPSPSPTASPTPSHSPSPSQSPPPSSSPPPPSPSTSPSTSPSPGVPRPRRLPPELQRRGEVKKTPGERAVRYEVEREETLRFRLELPGEGHRMRMEDAAGQVVFDIGNGETSPSRVLRPGRYRLIVRHGGRGDRLAFFIRRQGDLLTASVSCRGCDLHGANLANMDLSGADFGPDRGQQPIVSVNLAGANLANTLLRLAILEEADLAGANLTTADLTSARLAGARLRDARLAGATWTDGRTCGGGSQGTCN